jgi:hypothetical protein
MLCSMSTILVHSPAFACLFGVVSDFHPFGSSCPFLQDLCLNPLLSQDELDADESLSEETAKSVSTLRRTCASVVDVVVGIGGDIAQDFQRSFALATGGPREMQGKKSTRGSVVTPSYMDAELREAAAAKAAKKRSSSADSKSAKVNPKPAARQATRKRQRQRGSSYYDEVFHSSFSYR